MTTQPQPIGGTTSAHPRTEVLFRERWRTPWWFWLVGLALAAATAAAVHLGYPGPRAFAPYVATVSLVSGLLWWLGRIEVRVTADTLHVDDAVLPRRVISCVTALSTTQYQAAMGPRYDPMAFVVRRPWLRGAVLIELCDPADPTPYWII
ncbi:MAG: DUF3093 domain-containing protein, partial [Mycobacteriales bacterium]